MTPSDPFSLLPAWILVLAGLFSAGWVFIQQARLHRRENRAYTLWRKLRDVAVPLGMAVLGLQALLVGYHLMRSGDLIPRLLTVLATLGIVGGIAGFRIRRLPG